MQNHIAQFLSIPNSITIEHLYDVYGPALYSIILRIVHTEELARMVMQDTFLKVSRQDIDYNNLKVRSLTWILMIARSTAIDALTTTQSVSKSDHKHLDVMAQYPEKIDEKHQEMIDLIYFKGYTRNETSEEMNIPINSIKTQLRLAISELRKLFKEPGTSAKDPHQASTVGI